MYLDGDWKTLSVTVFFERAELDSAILEVKVQVEGNGCLGSSWLVSKVVNGRTCEEEKDGIG